MKRKFKLLNDAHVRRKFRPVIKCFKYLNKNLEIKKAGVSFLLLVLMSFLNVSMSFDFVRADEAAPGNAIIETGNTSSGVAAENLVNNTKVAAPDPTPTPTPEVTPTPTPVALNNATALSNDGAAAATTTENISVENSSKAAVSNEISSTASTGENSANGNSATSTIITGDANASADVVNIVNSNFTESNGRIAILNAFYSLFGDLDLSSSISTFSCPDNCSSLIKNLSVKNENSAEITNDILVRSHTGDNSASGGSSGVIATGDANSAANVLNVVNTNVVGSNYLLLVFNNFGSWDGDLVFPSKYKFNLCCTGGVSGNFLNENKAEIENRIIADASSGKNSANGSGGVIVSGNSNAAVNVLNRVNTNIFDSDSVYVAFRFFGDWSGNVYSAPDGFSWARTDDGLILLGGGNSGAGGGNSTDVSNKNNVRIKNNVHAYALTGQNMADGNTLSGRISSGNANSAVNVVNVVNTNVLGRNWVLALVNIFGDWKGNIAFGRPDLWIGESASSIPHEAKPGDVFTYKLTVINNGDTDATQIALSDDFDEHFLTIKDPRGGVLSEDGKKITWDLGTLKPGESRIISYDVGVKDNLPEGDTVVTNTASINAFEKDASQKDNIETTSIVLTRVPTYVPNAVNNTLPDFHIVKTHSATSTLVKAGDSVDYKIVLTNNGSGQGYESKIVDELFYATGTEPITTRQWNLDTVLGGEEITVTYTLEIPKTAKPGIYRNVAKFFAKDELQVDRYALSSESYIEVVEPGEVENANASNAGGGIGSDSLSGPAPEPTTPTPTPEGVKIAVVEGAKTLGIEKSSSGASHGKSKLALANSQFPPDQLKDISENDKQGLNLAALAYLNSRFLLPIIFAAFLALLIAYYLKHKEDKENV